jgi:HK97 family phage major capsid protein
MSTKRLQEVLREQDVIRARLDEIAAMPEPEGDEATRSKAFDDRGTETDDLLARWDELEEEREPLAARQARLDAIRSLARDPGNRDGADREGKYLGQSGPEIKRKVDPYADLEVVRAGYARPEDVLSRAAAAVDQAPRHMNDEARQHVTRLIEAEGNQAPLIARHLLMTGSEQYHEEFKEYVKTRYVGEAMRAAMSLTDANGGYLVPFTLDPTVILTNSGIADPIRGIARNVQIATNDWNGVTSAGVTAEWLGEGVEAADASPTFGNVVITPKKAAAWVQGSYEVLADSGFASSLGRLLADAKARLEGAAFATGNTGATVPRGIVSAVAAVTAQLVTSAAINALAASDVYNVAAALRPRDAAQASWLANKAIQLKIRQFDTAGGSAFWASLGMSTPPQLLGQPIYEASTMQAAVTTSGLVLLAGNFQEYKIVDRIGMSVQYQPMVMGTTNNRPTGQAGWFAHWRVGADVTDVAAFKLLLLHTTATAVALA